MKTFLLIVASLIFSLSVFGQTRYYKYEYSVTSNGIKQKDSGAMMFFVNCPQPRYVTFYNQKNFVAFTWKDGISSCYYKYEKTQGDTHIYSGPYWDNAAEYGSAVAETLMLGDTRYQKMHLYFSSDFDRLNIKMLRTDVTHVLQRSTDPEEIEAPAELY